MTPKKVATLAVKVLRERLDMIEKQLHQRTDADDKVHISISNEFQSAVVRTTNRWGSDALGIEEFDTMHIYGDDEEEPRALGYGELAHGMLHAIAEDACEGLVAELFKAREKEDE